LGIEVINPKTVSKPIKPTFSQAVKVTGKTFLFISGQVSVDKEGNTIGKGDVKAQTRQVIENIRTLIENAGGTIKNIIKVTVYLVDMEHFDAVHEVRKEYFKESPPASTLVQVSRLVSVDWLIEIDAIAILD
jgi:2-iminobutanoate/2-iminopropanoate deaminase